MKNQSVAKEQLEQISSRLKYLRSVLHARVSELNNTTEKLIKRIENGSSINSLGEIQGSGLQIDLLCAQICELNEQAAELGHKLNGEE